MHWHPVTWQEAAAAAVSLGLCREPRSLPTRSGPLFCDRTRSLGVSATFSASISAFSSGATRHLKMESDNEAGSGVFLSGPWAQLQAVWLISTSSTFALHSFSWKATLIFNAYWVFLSFLEDPAVTREHLMSCPSVGDEMETVCAVSRATSKGIFMRNSFAIVVHWIGKKLLWLGGSMLCVSAVLWRK